MYQRTRNEWTKHVDFIIIDILCLQISFVGAYLVRFGRLTLPYGNREYLSLILVLTFIELVASLALNSYSNIYRRGVFAEIISVGILSFTMLALVSLYLFSVHTAEIYSRLLVYYTLIVFLITDIAARSLRKLAVIKHRARSGNKGTKSLLVVTEESFAERIVADIHGDVNNDYIIKGLVISDASKPEICGLPVVASPANAAEYICREWVDEVLLYFPEGSRQQSGNLVEKCAEMGVTVHTIVNLSNVDRNKQFIEEIGNHTVLTTAFNYIDLYQAVVKRVADILGGIVGSIFAVLIGIVIGPIIYINSPGPIIFKQTRIGRNGKEFKVLKFRSMYLDADERKKEYMAQNRVADGMMFKLDFDPRIIGNKILPDGTRKTGIGDFIRKTSLDEFPQFINVLKGEMSLVGTRPPTVDEWEKYQFHHRARLAIKPGITGMWQVSGRSDITDFEEVVKLDTEYICNFRLSLDLKILFKTVLVLFRREGAM